MDPYETIDRVLYPNDRPLDLTAEKRARDLLVRAALDGRLEPPYDDLLVLVFEVLGHGEHAWRLHRVVLQPDAPDAARRQSLAALGHRLGACVIRRLPQSDRPRLIGPWLRPLVALTELRHGARVRIAELLRSTHPPWRLHMLDAIEGARTMLHVPAHACYRAVVADPALADLHERLEGLARRGPVQAGTPHARHPVSKHESGANGPGG